MTKLELEPKSVLTYYTTVVIIPHQNYILIVQLRKKQWLRPLETVNKDNRNVDNLTKNPQTTRWRSSCIRFSLYVNQPSRWCWATKALLGRAHEDTRYRPRTSESNWTLKCTFFLKNLRYNSPLKLYMFKVYNMISYTYFSWKNHKLMNICITSYNYIFILL